jgi:hypothetical protein
MTGINVVEKAIQELKRSVEITRDVRFQAQIRLSRRQTLSSYMISFLSLFIITLSLIPEFVLLKPYQNQILLVCSVVLSVFVIFTSLLDGAQNFFYRGEMLHSCPTKLGSVAFQLNLIDVNENPKEALEKLIQLQKEYQSALDECPTNHDNADYFKQKADRPHLFPRDYEPNWKWRKNVKQKYFYFQSFRLAYAWMFLPITAQLLIFAVVLRFVLIDAEFTLGPK